MSTTTSTDRMEKQVTLKAPRSRVWRAISDSKEFGTWFQCKLEGPFTPGAHVHGRMTFPGYEHVALNLVVERVEPERLLSYRWHPGASQPNVDLASEPMTLVEFRLEDAEGGGTRLTIVESGFDAIPLARRAAAFKSNDGGWTMQLQAIEDYLRRNP